MFKNNIISHIYKHVNKRWNIHELTSIFSINSLKKTKRLIQENSAIIINGSVYNKYNYTYGLVDLLIRDDVWYSFFLNKEDYKNNEYNYYVPINIINNTIFLRKKGYYIQNSPKIKSHKTQLYLLNEALGKYKSKEMFIIGTQCKCNSNPEYKENEYILPFGCIDVKCLFDCDIPTVSKNAIDYYKQLVKNSVDKHSLYPNMKIKSMYWSNKKKKYAQDIGEITQLWNCGVKKRNKCIQLGITSFYDKRLNGNVLGFTGKREMIINNIININRSNKNTILPRYIRNNTNNWKGGNNVYIDFETISDKRFVPHSNFIFLIGLGRIKRNGRWSFQYFRVKDLTIQEEYRIMKDFFDCIQSLNNPNLIYWHAEKYMWNKACQSVFEKLMIDEIVYWNMDTNWLDFCEVFKSEPIVIHGCFGFGLKEIAKRMHHFGFINSTYNEQDNGLWAMSAACNYYEEKHDKKEIKKIINYNETDCKILYEIVSYLKNHGI